MAGQRSTIRTATFWFSIAAIGLLLASYFPHLTSADQYPNTISFEVSPTVDDNSPKIESVVLPAGPAVEEGSSGPNVRSRTDQRGTDQIPEAQVVDASPVAASPVAEEEPKVPRLDDPVLRWLPEIMAASELWNVPPEIIAGIIRIESQGEPGPISPSGARGLVQMMPDGLNSHGIPESLWHDPATNIEAGAWGLAWRFNAQGSWEGAVGAYLGFGCDIYGTCTDVYVRVVLGWADFYRSIIADPLNAGFEILPDDWAYGPIRIFQMPNPPTPEPPPDTPTPSPTPKPTKTPKPGDPTSTPIPTEPGQPSATPVPTNDAPTAEPTSVVSPTTAPPTDVPPTEAPTEPPPPTEAPTPIPTEPPPQPTEVPTEPPPPPTDIPPTEEG